MSVSPCYLVKYLLHTKRFIKTKWFLSLAIKENIILQATFVFSVLKTLISTPTFPRTHKKGSKIHSGSDQTDMTVFQHCFCKDYSILKTK